MKITSFFSVLALVMCLTTTGFAQKRNQDKQVPARHRQTGETVKPWFVQDDLFTNEQQKAFRAIRLKSMKEAQPLRDQLNELKAHQRTLMNADKPDMKAIYINIDKMSDIENQLAKIKIKGHIEMMSYLTDEQKLQVQHFYGRNGNRRSHHRGQKENPAHPGFIGDQI